MELTYQEVQRAGCLMEIDIARFLRAHDGAQARQMDRKSVRRLLGDLEEQVSVFGLWSFPPSLPPSLPPSHADLGNR
jgi:hypothetical protein